MKRVTQADRRARALQLNPAKRQNNVWSRNFTVAPRATDIERIEAERIARCCGFKD